MSLLDQFEDQGFECPELITAEELERLYERDLPELVALDTESPTFRWHLADADPFAMTVSWGRENTYYVNVRDDQRTVVHESHPTGWDPSKHRVREDAARVAHRIFVQTPTLVFHNAKYDLHVFKRVFDAWRLPLLVRHVEDTMIMSAILDEQRHHGLKELCTAIGISYDGNEAAADAMRDQIDGWRKAQEGVEGREVSFAEVPLRLMVPYAVRDAYMTWELWHHFRKQMEEQSLPVTKSHEERDLFRIYALELRLLWVLFNAEERGMRVDLDFIHEQIANLVPSLEHIRSEMSQRLGWEMNPGSTEDVAKALKQEGVAGEGQWVNPRTGKHKLPEWVLADIDHPFARAVLEYRTAQKVLSSYFEPLSHQFRWDPEQQAIVRCNFKQQGARTGRMSITEPALQTIPREKGNVRGAFIARKGCKLIFADFKNQELRVLGHYMAKIGEPSMKEVFEKSDADPHAETAAAMYKVSLEQVTKPMRYNGKTLNFAICYGAGQQKISDMLGVPLSEGKQMLYSFYDRFPGVRMLKARTTKAMENRGYVVTVFGRRHRERDGRYAYKAVNSLVQGTSADLAKAAMVKCDDLFIQAGMRSRVLLQIHDELVVEAPDEEMDQALVLIRQGMTLSLIHI